MNTKNTIIANGPMDRISPVDQMIKLARVFSRDLEVNKTDDGIYLVSIRNVRSKKNRLDVMLLSICGRGRRTNDSVQG